MSILARNIVRGAFQFWQNPSETDIPLLAVINALNRCVNQRLLDLELSDKNFFIQLSAPFSFTGDERSLLVTSATPPITDISIPVRVESRGKTSTSDNDWCEEEIVDFGNWNNIRERSTNAVAFYGMPPDLTMVVNRRADSLVFRVIYENITSSALGGLKDSTSLPPEFEAVLTYDLALEMGELIDDNSPEFLTKKGQKMPYLLNRLDDTLERFYKWKRNRKGQASSNRRGFNDRDYPNNTGLGKRRFSVRF